MKNLLQKQSFFSSPIDSKTENYESDSNLKIYESHMVVVSET